MALRRGSHVPLRPRSRRVTNWGLGPNGDTMTFTTITPQIASSGVFLTSETEATIVRVRGDMQITQTGTNGAGAGFAGAIGMGLVNSEAFTAGIASVPSPIQENSWPGWLWYHHFNVFSITGTIADGANAASIMQRITIDSKAMRKWGQDQTLLVVIEPEQETGAATMVVNFNTRVLVKLH